MGGGRGSKIMKNGVKPIIYNSQRSIKLSMFSVEQFYVNSISEAGKNMKWIYQNYDWLQLVQIMKDLLSCAIYEMLFLGLVCGD